MERVAFHCIRSGLKNMKNEIKMKESTIRLYFLLLFLIFEVIVEVVPFAFLVLVAVLFLFVFARFCENQSKIINHYHHLNPSPISKNI